jgi:hypothetical protein
VHALKILAITSALAFAASTPTATDSARRPAQAVVSSDVAVAVIRDYTDGLSGIRAANPDVHLSVGRDPAISDEPVLIVEYPQATNDPAGRDVQCDAESRDWTVGRAISFQIKPAHPLRLSVSFLDRNHVAYTTWISLQGGVWQRVRIPFENIRPNPYFQSPDARTGSPLDVSEVKGIAFAPQDQTSGHLAISKFVVSK